MYSISSATEPFPKINFNQSIGLINIPTADILKNGGYRFSIDSAPFSYGLFDFFEVGMICFHDKDANGNETMFWGNRVVIKLVDGQGECPSLAIGAESVMQAPSNGKTFTSHFLVTSQRLDNICTLHVGVGDGRFVGYGPNSQVLDGIFGGVERDFSIMERQVTFKLEEDGKDINLGVKAPIFPNLFFLLTVAQLDNWIYKHTAPDNNPYIYIGFTCEGIWEQK